MLYHIPYKWGFPGSSVVKNPPAMQESQETGNAASIPGLGRSPEEGDGNPLDILVWRIPWTESLAGYSP